jgi:hypothetical protein
MFTKFGTTELKKYQGGYAFSMGKDACVEGTIRSDITGQNSTNGFPAGHSHLFARFLSMILLSAAPDAPL